MQSVTHRAHWHSGRVSKKHGGMSGNAFLSSASGGGLHLVENSCAPFPFQPKGIRGRQYSSRCNLTCLLQWKTIKPWFQFLSVSFGQYIDAETLQKWSELLRYVAKQKKRYYLGIFPNMGGGDLPKSQNFCKFTKYFFVCQIHSEVLKHVLQMGG